jgi:hypothetical protein
MLTRKASSEQIYVFHFNRGRIDPLKMLALLNFRKSFSGEKYKQAYKFEIVRYKKIDPSVATAILLHSKDIPYLKTWHEEKKQKKLGIFTCSFVVPVTF